MTTETHLMQEAATFARGIVDGLSKARPEDTEALASLVQAGRVQFDVRIRDVLGGMPRIDLVAVTAMDERVIGSKTLQGKT